jgi:hypothetical protein
MNETRSAGGTTRSHSTLRAIVMSVALGVCWAAIGSLVISRIETAVFGGAFEPLGTIVVHVFTTAAAVLYYELGGVVCGLVNPIIGVLTAAAPTAPIWFVNNIVRGLATGYFARRWKPNSIKMYVLVAFLGGIVTAVIGIPTYAMAFGFPTTAALLLWGWGVVVGAPVGAIIAKYLVDAIRAARLA